ncbi:MAG: phosphoglycerate dehydrogenase [Candidatus Brocadiaceae bacterium]|jgi:D-3-phosphoglycerate dehydrogenase
MKTVLVADKLPDRCSEILQGAGLEVVCRPGLSEDELKEAVKGVSGIVCRSGARITAQVLEQGDRLEAICRAGVGVDNIDVAAASRKGVVVMNTPGGNTISTAEHAFALMLGLARNIGPAYISMREERWDKKEFIGRQLAGSILGIVGLGRIGQTVARRAIAFGMSVVAYDPYLSRETAEKAGVELVEELDDLLKRCDYLTVHVPENEQTEGLIGAEQIARMKKGARVINCARGSVVDQEAVVKAVEEGRLGGAAFDVYVSEPPEDYSFVQSRKILATPHLGASTEQAQLAVATDAAEQMVDALQRQHFRNALNTAAVPPEEMKALQPYCDLAARLGALVAQLNRGRPEAIEIACEGELAEQDIDPIVNYGAMGVLRWMLGDPVNIVSAPHLAEERGIHITSSSTVGLEAGFTDLVTVKLVSDSGELEVAGTVFGRKHQRVVRIGEFYVEVMPTGELLAVYARDMPGLIGRVGVILGEAGINIARMGFGRREVGGDAILVLNLDSAPDAATVERIRGLDVVHQATPVAL